MGMRGGQPRSKKSGSGLRKNPWFSENPSKIWGKVFFLKYTPFWLTLCLGIVVPLKLYESFSELEYLLLGLISAVPAFLVPLFLVGKADKTVSWTERYWVKANLDYNI